MEATPTLALLMARSTRFYESQTSGFPVTAFSIRERREGASLEIMSKCRSWYRPLVANAAGIVATPGGDEFAQGRASFLGPRRELFNIEVMYLILPQAMKGQWMPTLNRP